MERAIVVIVVFVSMVFLIKYFMRSFKGEDSCGGCTGVKGCNPDCYDNDEFKAAAKE